MHFPCFHTRFVNMGEIIEYLELRVQLLIFFFMHMSQVIKCSNSRRIKLEKERLVRLKQRKIQQRCRINRFKKLMLGRRKLFFCILMNLTSHSVNREIWVRFPIPVGKRIMVSLWRLATNIEFRTLGHLFGINRGTACVVFHETIKAINTVLLPKYLKFSTGQSHRNVVDGFRTRWGFPQCCGAIADTHIPIIAPHEHHADYYNRKCHHSVIMQAVVDYNYRFININVGHAGKHHDAHVVRESSLQCIS